jgi:hypothetical protein
MSKGDVANWASIVCALLAAVFWAKVAYEKIPDRMGLTADQTNFDWLGKPLTTSWVLCLPRWQLCCRP